MALLETFSDFTSQRFYFVMESLGASTDMVRWVQEVQSPICHRFCAISVCVTCGCLAGFLSKSALILKMNKYRHLLTVLVLSRILCLWMVLAPAHSQLSKEMRLKRNGFHRLCADLRRWSLLGFGGRGLLASQLLALENFSIGSFRRNPLQ